MAKPGDMVRLDEGKDGAIKGTYGVVVATTETGVTVKTPYSGTVEVHGEDITPEHGTGHRR
jgi:hypothetical protein